MAQQLEMLHLFIFRDALRLCEPWAPPSATAWALRLLHKVPENDCFHPKSHVLVVSLHLRPTCSVLLRPRSETWSVWQQRWCCRNRGMGCEPLALPFGSGPKEVTKVETIDCSVGGTWTEAQRRICCQDHGVGCLGTPAVPVPAPVPVPVPVAAVPASRVFSAAPYHCRAGSEEQWSNSKRHFCCKVRKVGCDFHSGALASSMSVELEFGLEIYIYILLKGIPLPSLGQLRL